MGKTSDPQRDGIYRAQRRIDPGAQLHTARQVDAYVQALTTAPWWTAHGYPSLVAVRARTGRRVAAYGGRGADGWYVSLPGFTTRQAAAEAGHAFACGYAPVAGPWAWRELYIVHELAHVATIAVDDDHTHGARYATRLLELTDAVLGPWAALQLALAYQTEGVAFDRPEQPTGQALSGVALAAARWRPLPPARDLVLL